MTTIKISESALESLLGQRITLFCCRYIYTGILKAIYDDCVLLDDNNGIVYETGAFDNTNWKDFQKLPYQWFVSKQSIDSFGVLK
jgi:hypothetical protein